ncbi:MAG: glycosyltransferase family 39 protein [Anaerolineaceae bacterium]|nr:glycosyltransferase family 39 protein [Anaerolineaceae bacterium]
MRIERSKHSLADWQLLLLLAAVRLLFHVLTNNQYGFHRDALAFLDNGQHLAWGYVAYPPLTPFVGRVGLELFGLSLVGIKSLAALAQCVAMVFTGLMAKELGGGRGAQAVAAIAAGISIMSLLMSTLFQYISFDYLWWVLALYCFIRLLKSGNPRWWLGIGAAFGLGMMTKYTMVILVTAVILTVLLTKRLRTHLKSPWLWAGAGLSLLIFLPNLIWQFQNNFVSLEFLAAIRARDVALGRTEGYLAQQFYVNLNPDTVPLFLLGMVFYLRWENGRFRPIAWIYLITLALFGLSQGRFYYLAPAYPMILAGGAVWGERWLARLSADRQKLWGRVTWGLLAVGAAIGVALALPVAPINSALWDVTSDVHDNFAEQIGWAEMAQNVATIYAQEAPNHANLGILTGNYGEAAALNLYGPRYGLQTAVSPVNSYWQRGYGTPPPDAVIVLGFSESFLSRHFGQCTVVGRNSNRFGVANEESKFSPDIFLCEDLLKPWEQLWPEMRAFG